MNWNKWQDKSRWYTAGWKSTLCCSFHSSALHYLISVFLVRGKAYRYFHGTNVCMSCSNEILISYSLAFSSLICINITWDQKLKTNPLKNTKIWVLIFSCFTLLYLLHFLRYPYLSLFYLSLKGQG